jgi:hypothetical protein
MVDSRFYTVKGVKWEARFFSKGATFPDTRLQASRQGVWARPVPCGWDSACFVGASWRFVRMDTDVLYFPEKR